MIVWCMMHNFSRRDEMHHQLTVLVDIETYRKTFCMHCDKMLTEQFVVLVLQMCASSSNVRIEKTARR